MLPPWQQYPEFERYSMEWRRGDGERYLAEWAVWFDALGDEEKRSYIATFPEPAGWNGYYEGEEIEEFTPRESLPESEPLPIDHARIIDGFGELVGVKFYRDFHTYCGICDAAFVLSTRAQKYILEINGVPVKALRQGAAYCPECTRRRGRINWLKKGDRYRDVEGGAEELERLRAEERALQMESRHRYEGAKWPYE